MKLAAWPKYRFGGYELDFSLRDYLLDVEADGELFHSSIEKARKRDIRDAWLETRGYKVLRLTGSVIMNDSPLVIRLVNEAVGAASQRPATTISVLEPESFARFEARVSALTPIKVVELSDGQRRTLRNVVNRDDTGDVPLALWGEDIARVSLGDRLRLVDVLIKQYKGRLEVSRGPRGSIDVIPAKSEEAAGSGPAATSDY